MTDFVSCFCPALRSCRLCGRQFRNPTHRVTALLTHLDANHREVKDVDRSLITTKRQKGWGRSILPDSLTQRDSMRGD